MSLFDLSGKVAVVTGSTKGIGLGIAREMAAAGARVVVASESQDDCDAVAAELNRDYGRGAEIAKALAFDLTDLASVEAFAAKAPTLFGGLDILVCNAAVMAWPGPPEQTPPAVFDQLLSANIHHNYRLCIGVRAAIAARGGGSIVLIGSGAGLSPHPQFVSYSVAKAGVAHLAWNLAQAMAPDGIRVNCVAPGLIRSFTTLSLMGDDGLAQAGQSIPLGRVGRPEDIAGAVIFLASTAGAFVTGETISVDGGTSRLTVEANPLTAGIGART